MKKPQGSAGRLQALRGSQCNFDATIILGILLKKYWYCILPAHLQNPFLSFTLNNWHQICWIQKNGNKLKCGDDGDDDDDDDDDDSDHDE